VDDWQARAIQSVTKRHEEKVRQYAERIQEHIGYVLTRLDAGKAFSVGHYASGIASDAHEIVSRIAALEALGEATGILSTTENPPAPGNRDCPRCSGGNPNSCSCLADCGYPACSARPPED